MHHSIQIGPQMAGHIMSEVREQREMDAGAIPQQDHATHIQGSFSLS